MDLKDTLEGFGLAAIARQGVTVDDLVDMLTRSNLAIFPSIGSRKLPHYYVAMIGPDDSPIIVDVTVGIAPLSRLTNAALRDFHGLVLIVSRERCHRPMADLVRVSPNPIDLGDLSISGVQAKPFVQAVLEVSNPTNSAIMVCSIQTSCGCAKPTWNAGLLRPKEDRNLTVNIRSASWGEGEHSKQIVLRFGDGSGMPVRIHGRGISPEIARKLRVSTNSIIVDVTDRLQNGGNQTIVSRFSVMTDREIRNTLEVSTDAEWLVPIVRADNDGSTEVELRALLSPAMAARFCPGPSEMTQRVFLKAKPAEEPITVEVKLVSRSSLAVRPGILRLVKGASNRSSALVTAIQSPSESLHIHKVSSRPSGLLWIQAKAETAVQPS